MLLFLCGYRENESIKPMNKDRGDERFIWEYEKALKK